MLVFAENKSGVVATIKVGFSWTSFFFGPFVLLFRGLVLHSIAWFIAAIFTGGLSNIILAFIINKTTGLYKLENGYTQTGDNWSTAANEWGINCTTGDTSPPQHISYVLPYVAMALSVIAPIVAVIIMSSSITV